MSSRIGLPRGNPPSLRSGAYVRQLFQDVGCRASTASDGPEHMFAHISTVAFLGIDARPVDVQVQIGAGLPSFSIVGLPDKAVAESRERVRAALCLDRPRASGEAHHGQSRARRSAQGRQPLRPPDRGRPDGGKRRHAGRGCCGLRGHRRIGTRRLGRGGRGLPARRDRRQRSRQRPDLPFRLRQRGRLGVAGHGDPRTPASACRWSTISREHRACRVRFPSSMAPKPDTLDLSDVRGQEMAKRASRSPRPEGITF